jgi:hypothetical protein
VAAAPLQDATRVDSGRIWLFRGSAAGLEAAAWQTFDNPVPELDARFGFGAAGAWDVDADGWLDLVVGAPQQDNTEANEGNAFFYRGQSTGPAGTPTRTWDQPLDCRQSRFGGVFSVTGDVDGDGYRDVVVAAPFDNCLLVVTDVGAAYLFYGSASGPATTPMVQFQNPSAQSGSQFGNALAP